MKKKNNGDRKSLGLRIIILIVALLMAVGAVGIPFMSIFRSY